MHLQRVCVLSIVGAIGKRAKDADEEAEKEKLKQLVQDYQDLAELIYRMLSLLLAPTVPKSLKSIPAKYTSGYGTTASTASSSGSAAANSKVARPGNASVAAAHTYAITTTKLRDSHLLLTLASNMSDVSALLGKNGSPTPVAVTAPRARSAPPQQPRGDSSEPSVGWHEPQPHALAAGGRAVAANVPSASVAADGARARA
ncbi:hypothetical protein EIP86_005638 [Pleurotus ostreatoroseus]|nr:hypothetical protein EIP86_005638 [Pleurotus ostreatoroseus]